MKNKIFSLIIFLILYIGLADFVWAREDLNSTQRQRAVRKELDFFEKRFEQQKIKDRINLAKVHIQGEEENPTVFGNGEASQYDKTTYGKMKRGEKYNS